LAADTVLALDTSTRVASIALVTRDGRVRAERTSEVSTHSEIVLGLVDEALAEAKCPIGDLAAIACGAGPGSFTGLRIGLATAKGLCFASGNPLLLVPSLAALAAEAPPDTLAVACLDARKGEIFAAAFQGGRELVTETALRPEDLAAWIDAARERAKGKSAQVALVGDAPARYPELAALGSWTRGTPRASAIGRLAWQRLDRGESDDLDAAAPRYVRPPDITVKKPTTALQAKGKRRQGNP
jgi:tRNA threonylcarbamoyladenosine biosynthesis protein TsaB